MANPELVTPSEVSDPLRADLRKQLRAEIDGETLPTAERFALEQKYGIAETIITKDDAYFVAFSLGESLGPLVASTAEVNDVR